MTNKLAKYLEDDNVVIVNLHEVAEREKDIIAYYEARDYHGIALLHKGFNNKYQLTNLHKSTYTIAGVTYILGGKEYSIIYGKSDKTISKFSYITTSQESSYEVESKYLFRAWYGKKYDGIIGLNYVIEPKSEAEQFTLQSVIASTWKNILIPLRSIIIFILAYLFTTPLHKNANNYNFAAYNKLPKDGQGVRQNWYR